VERGRAFPATSGLGEWISDFKRTQTKDGRIDRDNARSGHLPSTVNRKGRTLNGSMLRSGARLVNAMAWERTVERNRGVQGHRHRPPTGISEPGEGAMTR
jgi:hypothetical protein